MSRRTRASIVLALALIGCGLAFFPATRSCPLDVELESVEPSQIMDESGADFSLVTLRIRNEGRADVWVGSTPIFEARRGARWETATSAFNPALLHAGGRLHAMLLAPRGAEACRVELQWQREPAHWRAKVMMRLGSKGRKLASQLPFLWRWLNSGMRFAPDMTKWRDVTLRVEIPQDSYESPEADQRTIPNLCPPQAMPANRPSMNPHPSTALQARGPPQ